ncbi:hypothetical protein BXZ70DRAFT_910445 [Cristinia sonorae]|uniref:Uncharacterized protein n=1 Tax=Cristinia sonorae TaxID=1940300 RepID=A0A8K0UG26_9AGAR|nr:hypothetical protein BXZ70DRAFT_910445 [Cristinia sonorae]
MSESAAALDLATVSVNNFWDKVVAANPSLEAVVKAATSGTVQIAADNGKLYINATNWYGTADIAPWITGVLNLQIPNWPWLPSSGYFEIKFDSFEVSLTLYDTYRYYLYSWTGQVQVPPSFVGLKAEGSWNSR